MNAARNSSAACRTSFVVVLMAARAAAGDDSESTTELQATPYRPTVSNPAALPVPHHLEWEAGGISLQGHGDDRRASVPYLLKYAFNEDVGVLVSGEGYVSSRTAGETADGFGDTTVSLKLHHAVTQLTALGLEAGVKLPTASTAIGSGHTDYTLNGILSTQAIGCDIDINAGYTTLGATDPGTHRHVLLWATAASRDVTERWGLDGEFSGTHQGGVPNQAQFLGAVTYSAAPTVVLDAGALAGLDSGAPRYGVFAGLTVLVP